MTILTEIHPIRTKRDYNSALRHIEKLFDAPKKSREAEVLDILSTLVEKYEEKHFPISGPDPVELIKFRMEQLGINQAELGQIIGGKNRASEILARKRPLTLGMIRALHSKLGIPADLLIAEYPLKGK